MSNVTKTAKISAFPKAFIEQLSDGTMDLFDWMNQAGTLGVDGVEMYPLFLRSQDRSYLLEVKAAAEQQGLQIPMMCSSPDFTHPSPDFREQEVEKMKRMIDVMSILGPESFRSCRVLSGQNRPGLGRKEGIRCTVDSIERLLPYAADKNVHLVIENHYKDGFWLYPEFAQPSDIFLEIVEQISSPWFGVNFDPSNAIVAGENPLELMQKVKGRIITMHASDRYVKDGADVNDLKNVSALGYSSALAHGVIGKGLNDYDTIFSILQSVDFRGWISIEDGMNGLEELRESAVFLRSKLKEYLNRGGAA